MQTAENTSPDYVSTHGAVHVEIDRSDLLYAIRYDCVTFLSFYLGEELTLEVPEFHQEIWHELLEILDKVNQPEFLVGHLQKLFAVPREHSKSTIAKLAVILFMRYSGLSFTLYVSKTNTIAVNACKDIVTWFKSANERELYGDPDIIKNNENESTWILAIGVPGRATKKRVILKAIGQGQQVRGTLIDNKRPEFVVLDDIEDYDTADGGLQQQKLDEWAIGGLMKATAKKSVRLFLGNMVRKTTLLARLSREPEWNPTVFGALVRNRKDSSLIPLWPGRWTTEALLADYRNHRRIGAGHVWETEMMNLSKDAVLSASLDNAYMIEDPSPEDVESGFLCLDPAFGKNSWNDESAITVHVRIQGIPIPVCVDSRFGRWSENEVLDELINLSYYWNLRTWVIESVAAQRLLIPLFNLLLVDRFIPKDTFLILPIQAKQEAKSTRITAFIQAIAARSYGLADSQMELKLKLEEYSPDSKDHDDLCDSGAYGPIVWNLYGTTVEGQGRTDIPGLLMQPNLGSGKNQGEIDVCAF